jgi:hypothetical protein
MSMELSATREFVLESRNSDFLKLVCFKSSSKIRKILRQKAFFKIMHGFYLILPYISKIYNSRKTFFETKWFE